MVNWALEFEKRVHDGGNRIAVVHDERTKTYNELNREASAFGNWVADRGFEKVALFLPSMYEFLLVQVGTLKAGASAVPVNYMFGEETINYVLDDSDASVIVTQAKDADIVTEAAAESDLEAIVTIGESEHGSHTLAEIIDEEDSYLPAAPKRDDELFNLNYTSGTTGDPKGVYKTHRNMSSHISNMEHVWKLDADETWINAGPLYHTAGLESCSLPLLQAGATVVLLEEWDVESFLELVEQYRPTNAYVVGSMLIDLANYPDSDQWDVDSLQNIFCGGAPVGQDDYDAAAERYDVVTSEFLGFTEAGISFTYPIGTPGQYDPAATKSSKVPESCGRPLLNQLDVRIADPNTDEEVSRVTPAGATPGRGELQLRGEAVFEKYYGKPEATEEAFTDEGWYKTGDVVSVDEDGYIYYEDRADNMLVTGGENVYPRSVEDAVNTHSKVHESAVFGLPHDRWGTQVCIAVVPIEGETITEAEIVEFCKESGDLADFEVPKQVFVRETIPKTPTNSIRRRTLSEEYEDEV